MECAIYEAGICWSGMERCGIRLCAGGREHCCRTKGGMMTTAMTMMQVQPSSRVEKGPGINSPRTRRLSAEYNPAQTSQELGPTSGDIRNPTPHHPPQPHNDPPLDPPRRRCLRPRRQRPCPEKERTDRSAAISSFEAPCAQKGTTGDEGSVFIQHSHGNLLASTFSARRGGLYR